MMPFLITPIYSVFLFAMTIVRNSIRGETKFLLSMSKVPTDDVLESLCKLRTRESDQVKTVLEIHEMEIHQKMSKL